MAINELFDSGIKITGSFSATGSFPVDSKSVVKTIAERDDHDTQNRSYPGMLVYVEDNNKTYQKSKTGEWVEFGFNQDQFSASVYDRLDSTSTTKALSANQGKVLSDTINKHSTDTVKHITEEERDTWNAKASTDTVNISKDGLMSKEDKAKLDNIEEGANNYIHPDHHHASMIIQDANLRFVTNAQINNWSMKPNNKLEMGLGNVTNDAQVKRVEMGIPNGVATLDDNGKVPSSQLPSFVDDVVEYDSESTLPEIGDSGKIYVVTDTNSTYRWSGTQYTKISSPLSLGETASNAYPGDKGKTNADELAKIKSGATIVPKAIDSKTVTGFTVETNVPADAKFTDTTYDIATQFIEGLLSSSDKVKLDSIDAGANRYVHPDDELTRHVSDAQIKSWNAKASTAIATTEANGLMSTEDKVKLDGIEKGANNYVHPNDENTRHVTDTQINNWNAKAERTTATISSNGLMSSSDKIKLDGIEEGANNYVHPDNENTRHVTDSQIASWNAKASTAIATTEANGLMSKEDKTKLDKLKLERIENINYLMTASEFTSNGKVKIPVQEITAQSTVTIGLDYGSVTMEQYDAAGLAKFKPIIVEGGIEVSCFGTKPTVDIPVNIAIVREI